MPNRGKAYPVQRRTNAQIASARRNEEEVAGGLAGGLANFFIRPAARVVQNVVQNVWDVIRRRDNNYEARRVLEIDNFDNDDDHEESDSDEDSDSSEDEDIDYSSDVEDEGVETSTEGNVMQKYLKAIRDRIQDECRTKNFTEKKPCIKEQDKWLLKYLNENQFWIRKEYAGIMCKRLKIEMSLQGYYRNVKVWLPDEEFKIMPICPSCKGNSRVGVHGYCDKTLARRVIGLNAHYFVMTRRYICHDCEHNSVSIPKPKFTFRGYNDLSVKRLPRQLGLQFPAVFTHMLAIDKSLIDLMRPLFDGGIRPRRFRNMILELHQKEHARLALLHEYADEGKAFPTEKEKERFSSFHDKTKYDSFIPGANWFQRCYCKFMKSIRPFCDNVMKIRPAEIIKMDVCYKPTKKFKHVNGQKVVSGVVTIKNENNEDRAQWFVPTDAKDQYTTPLQNMLETMRQLGQKGPRLAYVDNPASSAWLFDMIPSLRETQDRFDALTAENSNLDSDDEESTSADAATENASAATENASAAPSLPNFEDWFQKHSSYLCTNDAIETNAAALIGLLNLDDDEEGNTLVLGLDLEWFVPTANGRVVGPGERTSLIQIAYEDDNDVKVVLYHVTRLRGLPPSLEEILKHPRTRFAGAHVSGDVAKLNKDFNLNMNTEEKSLNLEFMAKSRGVCLAGKGLDAICYSLFNVKVSKDCRLENWKQPRLPLRLQKYAAKDAAYSLYAYTKLVKMPNLITPLTPSQIEGGMNIDVAPYLGSTSNIYNRGCGGATGIVVAETQSWDNIPATLKVDVQIAAGNTPGYYLVEIREVFAPAMKLKDVKIAGTNRYATLGDIGPLPARVVVPIEMLREHKVERPQLLTSRRTHSPTIHTAHSAVGGTAPEGMSDFLDLVEEDKDDEVEVEVEGRDGETEGQVTGDNELLMSLENADEIVSIERCLLLGIRSKLPMPGQRWEEKPGVKLDPPPIEVKDKISAILGSGFHCGHRVGALISTKQTHRKAFCVAFSEALYAWDEDDMNVLFDNMKEHVEDMDRKDFLLLRYFRRRYFVKRVKRHCLPPSKLYWRVRAVFEVFGAAIDKKTGKPLFNDVAWTKANGILKEILCGFYSDPPGEVMYKYELSSNGTIKRDHFGTPLLKCLRDTNALEGEHSHINNTVGKRPIGLEFVDHLLTERRHRSTINASKANRLGFPRIDHYDTWMIDACQERVEEKHNILMHPTWINASALCCKTKERFGFVSLASPELQRNINEKVVLPEDYVMRPSLKFLSDCTGSLIAPQPWGTSLEELKLYPRLLLQAQQKYNDLAQQEDYICDIILPFVNGKITPKIPVYNRLYAKKYSHNQRVKAATKDLQPKIQALRALNKLTTAAGTSTPAPTGSDRNDCNAETASISSTFPPSTFQHNADQAREDETPESNAEAYVRNHFPPTQHARLMPAMMPQFLPPIHPINFEPMYNTVFVGGVPMTSLRHEEGVMFQILPPSSIFPRQGDKRKRKERHCTLWCGKKTCTGAKTRLRNGDIRRCDHLSIFIGSEIPQDVLIQATVMDDDGDAGISYCRKKLIAFFLYCKKPLNAGVP